MSTYDKIKNDPEAMTKRKAYHAQWQRTNKDKVKAYQKAYWDKKKHPEDHVRVGSTVYYCYELFGEHLVQECTVEEITLDHKGIKSLFIRAVRGRSLYFFAREFCGHSLDEVAFTKDDADKWLEAKE